MKRAALAVLLLAVVGVAGCGDKKPAAPPLSPRTSALRVALRGTDRILVREGGHPNEADERKVLVDVRGVEATGALITGIQVDDARSGGFCACFGALMLQFYEGESLRAVISYHHGSRLRWSGGRWDEDSVLTSDSQTFMRTWLVQNGVDEALTRD